MPEKAIDNPAYECWRNMRRRCDNPNRPDYKHYGGRGIQVCPEWSSFHQFLADMGPRPSSDHSIERNDTNGNYEPSNCRWATSAEQKRNTRASAWVVVNGKKVCLTEAAELLGTHVQTFYSRMSRHGLTHQQAVDYKRI